MTKPSNSVLKNLYRLSILVPAIFFLFSEHVSAKEENHLTTTVLQKHTTWEGKVIIEGVVVIGRKGKLTIKPGTQIFFKKVDRNKDGIGDGEIRVLGQLEAQGSKNKPIVFQSFEANPRPKDWSYLLLFSSSSKNSIRHCQFRHGFSGLQVHFSTATVADSLFEDNNEGIRFGRAKLTLFRNTFQKNNIGVRFTRMEGPVEMSSNLIQDNRVGIFLVPSGQNIRDFFEPGRGGKAWNEGHLAINKNSIINNSEYNLKLGSKQKWDLQIANNYWGTTMISKIRATIFDKHRDPELGEALLEPVLLNNSIDTKLKGKDQTGPHHD